ncbi:carboxyl transferase domain-containing protein [Mangrovihabitans endophyticus]|uniref:Acetyl-CoA carboxylase carboxyltransferase subunit n=1 Tax=Mangrovihabitans endophyticus TaxID=1751298 RepID=A0A8J3FQI2_9ACTN|nr:carboxyl transferase domain-containing protein [Mangrovihabitans endophyticus]GGL03545.1 acetyl-CoA carboxylase carboxyltransferase subunit [Mangrovihabitans endophyticus]
MTVLDTAIDPRTPAYLESRSAMLERLAELEEALEAARSGGGEKWVTRHHARGKLLPRERVEMLLDRDSPFLELSPVAAWGSEYSVGASVATGIGVVEGVECVIIANDPTVDGGAVNPYTVEKIRRAARIASVNRLPLVNLVESTGAAAPAGPPPGGAIARDLSQLTADRVPTVCVVFGATTGDAAYLPALSDYTIMVRGHAKVLTIHPQPVRASGANGRPTPEVRSTPTVPAGVTGPADQLAEDERDGLRLARQCVRRFNWRKRGPRPRSWPPAPPRYDAEDLLTMAAVDVFEPREVLARILDDSDFDEFKPSQGTALVTGWGELHGYPVGVVANLGSALTQAETQKAVHFIQLANTTDTTLLFVQYTGAPAAADREAADVRHGAPLVHAVAKSTVPHLTLMIGATPAQELGGVYGRAYEPRFLFTWPVERSADAGAPTRMLTDDGVIDPRDTRTVLGLCLSAVHSATVEGAEHVGVFRP